MYYYSFTIIKNIQPVFINDYLDYIDNVLKIKYPDALIEYHFEDTNGLHLHGMIRTCKQIYIKSIAPGVGWKLDIAFSRSQLAWQAYIRKDTLNEPELIAQQWDLYREYQNFQENYSDDDYVGTVTSPNTTTAQHTIESEAISFEEKCRKVNLFTGNKINTISQK